MKYLNAYLVLSTSVDGYQENHGAYVSQEKALTAVEELEEYVNLIEVWIDDVTINLTKD